VEFRSIFQNVYSVVHSSAEPKSIDIELDFDNNLTLFADPHMIETVLRNLVSNAIKFTPESGKITVWARQTENCTEVRVTDTGVGISKEEVQHLFKLDSSVKRNGTNNEDGTGLGLILCYEFIQKHNGTIAVESEPGKGSSFYFIIPNAVQTKKLV
jgi:signal transduction histidine kinase